MAEAPPHLAALPRVAERALEQGELDSALAGAREPFVVRGLAAHWPLVKASLAGSASARSYLAERARDRSFPASVAHQGGDERLFYDGAMQMNFGMSQAPLGHWLTALERAEADPAAPTVYLSSIDIDAFFAGLGEANNLPLGDRRPIASIWIGSRTRIAAHNDVPDNLAVCAAGKRRFTLFPPEQFANLYPGPLEHNPGGRPVSMVDLHQPDLAAYPRFAAALASAQIAELEPGDAVFVPSLWWHHVEGLAPFNLLVNYWWRDVPAFLGQPEDALYNAVLAIRDLPDADRRRWRDLFEHYVFSGGVDAAAHLPEAARGVLAPLTPDTAGRIKAKLLRGLSR
ncbi:MULTISPECIES: cupin-like domain-containing protein [unclassified Novosphingobium]|uniref:cupin-like domain-containing protein n=1 Tax=unclassified Novosphingobium TaxID=2644732 RepID=UPI000EE74E0F|nr:MULTISPECIES: cupin-like domain-containing protein [unclassified Novosphingobium]HCF25115.1 cupin [Novosphingobium sp.]HQV02265.1 cupin-like domain-containing protein [Novosphingobium sp.]